MDNISKEVRFKKVAERRVNKILKSFISLGNCSNKRMYNWDEADLRKIWSVIDNEYKLCKMRYNSSKKNEFKL